MRATLIAIAVLEVLRMLQREAALEARRNDIARRRAMTMAGGDA